MPKKVFVSGCFDLLHSGHIEFFNTAASFGDLYVAVGSDRTVFDLKGRPPVNTEEERQFVISNLACVKQAFISRGSGYLDFEQELRDIHPDIFIVNEDGNSPVKRHLCEEIGIEYHVLRREPHRGLRPRSTTDLRGMCNVPYRIDVCGGWLDQPYVSKFYPGPVLTISLEPTVEFNERSGMATSTRRKAIEIWGPRLPVNDYEKITKILFAYDNPPGTKEVSGSQDAIGIVYPGLNKANYTGEYWPASIEHINDDETLDFIEDALYLVPLMPRESGYSVLSNTHIDRDGAKALSDAAENCWEAILAHDLVGFGRYFRAGYEAQIAMFPNMVNEMMTALIDQYRDQALGWKVSGAGGGGYLILVADKPIPDALQITIRRSDHN
jgi:cytidyltransferase-like protein